MTEDEARKDVVVYWLEKSDEAMAAAIDEFKADRLSFAVNRAYYACFYCASALLLVEGHSFSKHSGVRSALHRYYIRENKIAAEQGRFYDRLFDNRQRADYQELVRFHPEQVETIIESARSFMSEVRTLFPADFKP